MKRVYSKKAITKFVVIMLGASVLIGAAGFVGNYYFSQSGYCGQLASDTSKKDLAGTLRYPTAESSIQILEKVKKDTHAASSPECQSALVLYEIARRDKAAAADEYYTLTSKYSDSQKLSSDFSQQGYSSVKAITERYQDYKKTLEKGYNSNAILYY